MNQNGQVGDTDRLRPMGVYGQGSGVGGISRASRHSCALMDTGNAGDTTPTASWATARPGAGPRRTGFLGAPPSTHAPWRLAEYGNAGIDSDRRVTKERRITGAGQLMSWAMHSPVFMTPGSVPHLRAHGRQGGTCEDRLQGGMPRGGLKVAKICPYHYPSCPFSTNRAHHPPIFSGMSVAST